MIIYDFSKYLTKLQYIKSFSSTFVNVVASEKTANNCFEKFAVVVCPSMMYVIKVNQNLLLFQNN